MKLRSTTQNTKRADDRDAIGGIRIPCFPSLDQKVSSGQPLKDGVRVRLAFVAKLGVICH